MNLYHTNYSSTSDTLRPQFKMEGNKLFGTVHNQTQGIKTMLWFEVRGNKVFTTVHNPQGHDLHPWYEIRGDKVFQTMNHPQGMSTVPTFHIRK